MHRQSEHRQMRLLLTSVVVAAAGCATLTPSVGPCQALQVEDVGRKVLAVCWSDEASVLAATNRAELLGPGPKGVLELFGQFAEDRDRLRLRGVTEPRVEAGFRYQLSHPQIVQGRAQYDLEVSLPEPLPAASIGGAAKEVVDFLRAKHPNAPLVNLDLMPTSSGSLGSVTLHFDQWRLRGLTLSQYRSKS